MVRYLSEQEGGAELITCHWSNERRADDNSEVPYKWHSHLRGQLLCIQSGLVQIRTSAGNWVLPPNRAGWIPPGAEHSLLFCSATSGYSVLIHPTRSAPLPKEPRVLALNELLLSAVIRSKEWSQLQLSSENQRVVDVIIDEVCAAKDGGLYLPFPKDQRLIRITEGLLRDPGSAKTAEQWANTGGISARSLRRLISAETGLSFAQWRNHAKLCHALALLSQGTPVSEVSFSLGYSTPSNFIAMFKTFMGHSPSHYFAKSKQEN